MSEFLLLSPAKKFAEDIVFTSVFCFLFVDTISYEQHVRLALNIAGTKETKISRLSTKMGTVA